MENNISTLPIAGIKGYTINEYGEIKNIKTNKIIKDRDNGQGYLFTSLYLNGKTLNRKVHRLIALTFIPNPNEYRCVNHIDGNKRNNHVSNLEWCNHSHNISQAWKMGLRKRNPNGKLIINTQTGVYYNSAIEAFKSLEGEASYRSILYKLSGYTKNNTPLKYANDQK